MAAQWLDWAVILVTLGLTAMGGKAALHLLLPHTKTTPSTHKARTAVFLLLLAGKGSLLLHGLFVVSGHSFVVLNLGFVRIIQLICPLVFVNASVAYCCPESDDVDLVDRSHVLDNTGTLNTKKSKWLHYRTRKLESFLGMCLWGLVICVVTMTVFVPCVCPCIQYNSLSAVEIKHVWQNRGSTYNYVIILPPQAGPVPFELQYNPNSFQSINGNNESKSVCVYNFWPETNGWTCMENVYSELFVHCLFYTTLLLYATLTFRNLRQRVDVKRRESSNNDLSALKGENPLLLIIYSKSSSDDAVLMPAISENNFNINLKNMCHAKQTNPYLSQRELTMYFNEENDAYNLHTPISDTDDLNLPNRVVFPVLEQLEDKTNQSDGIIIKHEIRGSQSESHNVTMNVRSDLSSTFPETQSLPSLHQELHHFNGSKDCNVCSQIAPYVPLAAAVLLVQNVVVLPLWCAVSWSKTQELQLPPSCVFYLPIYFAMSFMLLMALQHRL